MREHPVVVPRATLTGSCCSTSEMDQRIALLHGCLDDLYANRLELPSPASRSEPQRALAAFAATVQRFEIPQRYFLDFIEGCRMDQTTARHPTWASLEKYCRHSAGVVGMIVSCILGLTHSDARRQAVTMGIAMELTRILRDVRQDFAHGRIYLPLEDMARFRYSERDLAAGVINEPFRELIRFEIARARALYLEAADGICWLAGDGSRLAAASGALMYSRILRAIERRNYDVFSHVARPGGLAKLSRIPAAWRLARRRSEQPVPRVFGG